MSEEKQAEKVKFRFQIDRTVEIEVDPSIKCVTPLQQAMIQLLAELNSGTDRVDVHNLTNDARAVERLAPLPTALIVEVSDDIEQWITLGEDNEFDLELDSATDEMCWEANDGPLRLSCLKCSRESQLPDTLRYDFI